MYQRELDIQDYISRAIPRKTIFKKIAEKYEISERTVERQYYNILKSISKLVDESRSELRNELMTRNDYIFKRAMEEGKFKIALDANMAQAKLAKLFDETQAEEKRPDIITLVEKDFKNKLSVVPGDE